jgi:hypothetical protein
MGNSQPIAAQIIYTYTATDHGPRTRKNERRKNQPKSYDGLKSLIIVEVEEV